MRIALRFSPFHVRFYLGGLTAFILSQLFLRYQDLELPGWLRFTQSATGAFATRLLALLCFLGFAYLLYRQVRATEGVSARSVTLVTWALSGMAGIAVLLFVAFQLFPFEILMLATALCTSG